MSLIKLSKSFPPRDSLASDFPAGDGDVTNIFYGGWWVNTEQSLIRKTFLINDLTFRHFLMY